MRTIVRRTLAPTFAVAAALLALAAPAVADDTPAAEPAPTTWQVAPSGQGGPGQRPYFVLEAAPGAVVSDVVGITNLSTQEITLRVFATDARTAASGDFDLLASAQEPQDVGAWTTFDSPDVAPDGTLTLPARSRVDVPFHITIPANATPGDHVGGIVTSLPSVRTTGTGEQVVVDARVAARTYLSVTGDLVPRLQVGDVRAHRTGSFWNPFDGDVEVTWTVTNTGNLRLTGTQHVAVDGVLGWGAADAAGPALPELLPGSAVEQTATLHGVPAAVLLTLTGSLQPVDATGRVAAVTAVPFTATLHAFPWVALLALALLAALGWLVVRAVRRRRATARQVAELQERLAAAASGGDTAETSGGEPAAADAPSGDRA
ncbi:WxL protein peptidoglycan domain-containing protein [Xylanimonas protaetiae]|uniref:DUF916 domain-containing protein n=1 Tax=Xylanimonas protaetiae TaxID=2509457 RepID=A0A4P6F6K3_9MICO|nr:DUF916 domain-containing protein [Xylanimonas protaetiae]QAY71274.1 DUF916 domain-containing protein [Xylanimonas protaetiae]